ncbi:MAG: SufE family protein, partial [Alphaproteobacteria bacterium]
QVWLITEEKNINEKSILEFKADSDSFLVKGLLAIIIAIFSMKTPEDILKIDHLAELKKLNLQENISQQRSNGLRAVITRVISEAQKRV